MNKTENLPEDAIVAMLLASGCSCWTHPRTHEKRIYLNKFARTLLQIEVDYYKTGNLQCFKWYDGVTSNTTGRKILFCIEKGIITIE